MNEMKSSEVVQNNEISKLKNLFSPNAEITKIKEGFEVTATLIDGITKTGDKKIFLKLSKLEKIQTDANTWITALEIKKISIENYEITSHLNTTYLAIRPEVGKWEEESDILSESELKENKKDNHFLNDILEGSGTSTFWNPIKKNKFIKLTRLKSADDLFSMFHEQGHINTKGFASLTHTGYRQKFFELNWMVPLPPTDKELALKLWKAIIKEEVMANAKALALIKKIQIKQNIFSESSKGSEWSIKKLMTTNLSTYLRFNDGFYLRKITKPELRTLMDPTRVDRFKNLMKDVREVFGF